MNHPDELLLLQYRFDTLEGADKERVADHLRTCSDCTIRYAALGKKVEKLSAWDAEADFQDGLVEQAMDRVRARAADDAERAGDLPAAAPPLGPPPASAEAPPPGASDAKKTPPPPLPRTVRLPVPMPEPEPAPAPEPPFPGLAVWLGLRGGLPTSTLRFALTALMAVAFLGLAGGELYWRAQSVKLDTRVVGPTVLAPGGSASVQVTLVDVEERSPVKGAPLELALVQGQKRWPLFKGTSDDQGRVSADFLVPDDVPPGAQWEVTARGLGETDTVTQPVEVRREVKLHLSTDKPLYQPGQTIHVRALALQASTLRPVAGEALAIEVLDPKGNRLGLKQQPLGRFGVGSFDFELADGIALGTYQVKAKAGEATSQLELEVARYTLPKFAITLTPERDAYLAGETLRLKVLARTFFGKPVGKAQVRAILARPNGVVLTQAQETTSGDGDAELSLPLPATLGRPGAPEAVRILAEVKDAAGQLESKQLSLLVGRELLSVALVPAQGTLAPGVANEVLVLTTTADGKPVAADVELELGGEPHKLRTGANGVGAFELTQAHGGGTVTGTARVLDTTGRQATLPVAIPVSLQPAFLHVDRALVAPGAKLEVKIRVGDSLLSRRMALELRREGQLLGRQELGALHKDGTAVATLTLPRQVTGALDLELVPLSGEVIEQHRPLPPPPPRPRERNRREVMEEKVLRRPVAPPPIAARRAFASRRLLAADPRGVQVTMSADQSPYRPGATAKLKFEVKDPDGKPRAAVLGLAVVDESLFALTTSRPALARAFFTLGSALSLSRGPLSAADLAGVSWTEAEQLAAKVLFAGAVPPPPAAEAHSASAQLKLARLQQARGDFDQLSGPAWGAWGALLALVLAVALVRRAAGLWSGLLLAGLAWAAVTLGEVRFDLAVFLFALGVLAILIAHSLATRGVAWGALGAAGTAALAWLIVAPQGGLRHGPVADRGPRSPVAVGLMAPEAAKRQKSFAADEGFAARPAAAGILPPAPAAAMEAPRGLQKVAGGKAESEAERAAPEPEPERREVRVRQYFPETLYVHPELVTGEDGVAELELPIADSITSWRITALANTADGKLGTLEEPLKVFQDFFVDLDTPVALVVGDTAAVPIAVHNHLGERQTVRLEVEPSDGFEVLGEKTVKLDVPAGQLVGHELKVRVTAPGKHALKVRADGTRLSDVVQRELRVFEAGEERSASVSGTLKPGQAVPVTIALPPSAQPGSARLLARFYGSRVASAFGGLEGALRQPHGCFEQTSSTTYPNVLIWRHLELTGKKDSPAVAQARQYVGLGYQKLLTFEVPGGGFEWFGRAPANQVLTAYGLLEFKDMAQVFPVDPNVIARTQEFLVRRQKPDGGWEADRANLADGLWRSSFSARLNVSAYIAWALAESGYRGAALERAADYLAQNAAQTEDPYTLALITGTLARAGHGQARAIAERLEGLALASGEERSFKPTEATVYYSRGDGAEAEATALAAQALMAAKTGGATVKGALSWLAKHRDYRGTWHSTQGTVLALRAILMGEAKESDQQVKISVNGGGAASVEVKASADRAATVDLAARVKAGDNIVTLESSGEAPFQVVLTWVQPWREAGADERDPLSLKVSFGRTKAKVGDIVPVDLKVTYRRPEASGMVVASLGVPAGLQVLGEDLEALKAAGTVARYELSPGVVNLYLDKLRANAPVALALRFKAASKVTTKGQGSLAYLYYSPEVRAKSPAQGMVID